MKAYLPGEDPDADLRSLTEVMQSVTVLEVITLLP